MLVDYQMERQHPDKKLFVSSSTTVPLHKRFIHAGGGATITLPNVSEAEGRKFVVVATAASSVSLVKVIYSDGGLSSLSTTIGTTGVEVEFESVGTRWVVTR